MPGTRWRSRRVPDVRNGSSAGSPSENSGGTPRRRVRKREENKGMNLSPLPRRCPRPPTLCIGWPRTFSRAAGISRAGRSGCGSPRAASARRLAGRTRRSSGSRRPDCYVNAAVPRVGRNHLTCEKRARTKLLRSSVSIWRDRSSWAMTPPSREIRRSRCTSIRSSWRCRVRHRGGPAERDCAYHQGTVWPWLIGAYADAAIAIGVPAEGVLDGLATHVGEWGLGSVSETTDGAPPRAASGCPFQAWSVSEVLRARRRLAEARRP